MADATPREIWDAPEPPDEMVWNACPYTRDLKDCERCPRWFDRDGDAYAHGCFTLASEVCRIVFAHQARLAPNPDKDSTNG